MPKTREEKYFDAELLIDSWKISSTYNGAPTLFSDQEALIRNRYGNTVRGRQVSEMPVRQLFNVAKSIYDRAVRITKDLQPGDTQVMPTLAAYRDALKQRSGNNPLTRDALSMGALANLDDQIENLEERMAIQLDSCNIKEDSPVITAYDALQTAYDRKEKKVA